MSLSTTLRPVVNETMEFFGKLRTVRIESYRLGDSCDALQCGSTIRCIVGPTGDRDATDVIAYSQGISEALAQHESRNSPAGPTEMTDILGAAATSLVRRIAGRLVNERATLGVPIAVTTAAVQLAVPTGATCESLRVDSSQGAVYLTVVMRSRSSELGAGGLGARALIVDDDLATARLVGKIIEDVGIEYRIAEDGETALSDLDGFSPDIVVLDY